MAKKTIEEQVEHNSNMLNVIERDIDSIKNNHLAHIQTDMDSLKQTIEKMDTRMWAVLILLVTSVMAGMFGDKLFNLLWSSRFFT